MYRKIQAWVEEQFGFQPKTCWIAHVLSDYGLTKRQAGNRIDPMTRKCPCPPAKRPQIVAALQHFQMVS